MLLILAAFVFLSVSARVLNVTIDDTLGDERSGAIPQYEEDWRARSVGGAPCNECRAQPDGTRVFKGTWHDKSTYEKDPRATVSLEFSGTRIYVFFVLFNEIDTGLKNTRLRFYLDGSPDAAGEFLHLLDPAGPQYLYDQLVFDSQSLEFGNHTLLVSSYSDGTTGSLSLFDYAVYTTDDDPQPDPQPSPSNPQPSRSNPQTSHSEPDPQNTQVSEPPPDSGAAGRWSPDGAAIGGAVGGGLAGALLLLGAAYWIYARRRTKNRYRTPSTLASVAEASIVEPFDARSASDGLRSERGYMQRTSKAPPVSPSPLTSPGDPGQLRSELGWVREELERVRRIAQPPDYTHASRDSHTS
ncbi:hypothetical protein AURDEDRAFT_188603 [Auricularia subglabra TFB-10046 SS5]|nr:hypothetical protein AURDEDRAFT_188603 [Auricularia subglabra TFB-10046 SS5]